MNCDDKFINRNIYRSRVSGAELVYFRVTSNETDLLIGACRELRREALAAVSEGRRAVKKAIEADPKFQTSLVPIDFSKETSELILRMHLAAQTAGTGPMASVAGMIAEHTGRKLLEYSPEVIVENGGDIFLAGSGERVAGIAAGQSPLSMKLGIKVDPTDGIGVCTSSGTYGHSLSFGRSDAAVVVARDTALADAVATMLGNKCKTSDDLASAVEWAASLPGVDGAVAVLGEHLAAAGNIELVGL